jgi:hypothetical protein
MNNSTSDRVQDKARRLVDIQLLHESRAVRFSCFHADTEQRCNVFRRFPFCNQLEHLPLSCRQWVSRPLRFGAIRFHYCPRDARTQIDQPTRNLLDRLNQVVGRLTLENVTFDPSFQSVEDVLVFIMLGQENGFGLRVVAVQFTRRVEAIHCRHGNVHHSDVRVQRFDLF